MKKLSKIIVLSLISGLIFTGCKGDKSREDQVSAMINKVDSPFFIISMTPQNIMDKSGVMDGVLPFTYELILSFFIDESVTGIDYSTKTQLIIGKGESFAPNTYGIFRIKDEGKFIDLIEKEANADIKEKDDMKYAIKESDGYCVTWNEEFAVIANIPMDITAFLTGKGGDQGMKMVNRCIEIIKAADEGEVNETYANFLRSDDDIAMYYDGAGFYAYLKEMSMDEKSEIDKMKDTYEGVSYEMFLNFNKGSIDFNMVSHIADDLKEELSFIGNKGVTPALLGYAKSANPMLYGTYNVNVEGLLTYMEGIVSEREFERMEDDLNDMGLQLDDAKKALSGEIVYMIDNVKQVEEVIDFGYGDPYVSTRTEPVFAIVVGVADPTIIQEMLMPAEDENLTAGTDEMGMVEEYDRPAPVFFANGVVKMGDAYLFLKSDVLFMSNDSAWANMIAADKGLTINDKRGVTKEMPFGMYIDFGAISKLKDLNDAEPYVKLFVDFYGSANIDGGSFSLTLKDESTNSLRVITQQIADLLNEMEKEGQELLEKELEESINEGLEQLDVDVDLDKVEESVEDAFNALDGDQ